MRYKYIMFDMDGTVLDTLTDLTNAVNHSLGVYNLPPRTKEEIRSFLGCGARQLINLSVPEGCDEALTKKVYEFYMDWYDRHCMIETAPYPGTLELMEKLIALGLKLCIVSNKPHSAVVELAERLFPGLLETAIGEKEGISRKPAPDMVLHAMELMGADRENSLYVGDAEPDIQTAQNAGIDCASVTWGFRDAPQLIAAGGKYLVNSMDELYELIIK